jgi:hypothetical protein
MTEVEGDEHGGAHLSKYALNQGRKLPLMIIIGGNLPTSFSSVAMMSSVCAVANGLSPVLQSLVEETLCQAWWMEGQRLF